MIVEGKWMCFQSRYYRCASGVDYFRLDVQTLMDAEINVFAHSWASMCAVDLRNL
jgi:hypothetical protein